MMKHTLSTLAIASLLFISCGNNRKCNCGCRQYCDSADSTAAAADALDLKVADKQNVDSSKYPVDKDGSIILSNSKTLNDWRGYGKDAVPESWNVKDSAIRLVGPDTGEAQMEGRGGLIFAHKLKNFEPEFEYETSKGGNSGVPYLTQEVTTNADGKDECLPIWQSASEYQALGDANYEDAKLGVDGNRQSASSCDMVPAKPRSTKPFGEWNKGRITVFKGTAIHAQNSENVVEYHLWASKWSEMLKNSEFKEDGEFPIACELLKDMSGDKHEEYIGFQDHRDDVWYHNVCIKIAG